MNDFSRFVWLSDTPCDYGTCFLQLCAIEIEQLFVIILFFVIQATSIHMFNTDGFILCVLVRVDDMI